ncbi:MAG: hypothetical protein HQK52_04365 [Oligoflexia bacterium]|nr:hypothetical protein [Oligoflexia bacterium]
MDHLHVQSPEMVKKLLWSYLMAFNSVRWYMANAVILGKTRPENISFKAFYQMLTVKVGKRGGRMEPRSVKKRANSMLK